MCRMCLAKYIMFFLQRKVKGHSGDKYNDLDYNNILVPACAAAGIAAFTGDGTNPKVMEGATAAIAASGGAGIPTVKPWDNATVAQKMAMTRQSGCFALAMDIDAAGLPFLQHLDPPAGSKTVEQLQEIAKSAGVPFILKGIMTVSGAEKAVEAGAAGIVVSNHGGRVLDDCPATAEVLADIVAAVDGRAKILVDGGIRTGNDVFKALALGADGVLIARPFVTAVYGGGADGVIWPLLSVLRQEMDDGTEVVGLIGEATFSSAIINAVELQEMGIPLVGEPASGSVDHFGSVSGFSLPNSGIQIGVSSKYIDLGTLLDADAGRGVESLEPDIAVPQTMADTLAGRDTAVEWLLAHP